MAYQLLNSERHSSQHHSDFDLNMDENDLNYSGSDSSGREAGLSGAAENRKRMRLRSHSLEPDLNDHDADLDGFSTEALVQQHYKKPRRQQVHNPGTNTIESPSPLGDGDLDDDETEGTHMHTPQLSDRETESQVPSSEITGSQSEVDWESLLCEDIDMLPPSNYEAAFPDYQARMITDSDDRGFRYDESNQGLEDEPWYPYDPESMPKDGYTEFHNDSIHNGIEGDSSLDQLICFGAIHKVGIKLLEQAFAVLKQIRSIHTINESLKERKLYHFDVLQEDKVFLLQQSITTSGESHPRKNIAVLNKGHTDIISQLAGFCTFEAYLPSAEWDLIAVGNTSTAKQDFLIVDLLLYGPKARFREVGKILDEKKMFLQEPDYHNPNCDYINPHMLDLSAVQPDHGGEVEQSLSFLPLAPGIQTELSWQMTTPQTLLKDKIASALKNMTRAHNLKRISADIRIRTPLKPYQEEALDFIMQRECGPVPEQYCLWKANRLDDDVSYTHAITSCNARQKPIETGGGILADEMGLGKTLTMLAAMIRTTNEAIAFATNTHNDMRLDTEHALIRSRATLVVVPSPLLLNEWMQEIKLHCDGFSTPNIYHNHGREGNASALADSDIVLSTYHTISSEASDKNSPLWQVKWFRIILDEAHIIRRASTMLFKAMKKLQSKFYWCLTGTPVQNSLEDLAALLSFIRASPLDDLVRFRKHVVAPLNKGAESSVENLRHLLDSVCLRRTKQLLHLPEAIFEHQYLRFSAKEEQQYNDTRDKLVKLINKNGLKSKNQKGFLGVLQLQLQLRRLCNHGTFQKASLGADEFDPNQAIALLQKQNIAKCEACSLKITGIQGIEETRNGNFTICGHLLCMRCVPKMKMELKLVDGRDGCFQCPLCPEIVFGDYVIDEISTSMPNSRDKGISAWQYFDKEGCSTKVSAVVADIEHHRTEGKSIIFSCWTRSLDLIGIFLTSRKIPFFRIDGSNSLGERKRILEDYQRDAAVKVLLMTTGTGAVGLNLTVANCVYLLELQWNPMVENQAVARVLRLGQTRNVRVVRYIMKGTVEEKEMQSQQIRKLEYAKVGWKEGEADCSPQFSA